MPDVEREPGRPGQVEVEYLDEYRSSRRLYLQIDAMDEAELDAYYEQLTERIGTSPADVDDLKWWLRSRVIIRLCEKQGIGRPGDHPT